MTRNTRCCAALAALLLVGALISARFGPFAAAADRAQNPLYLPFVVGGARANPQPATGPTLAPTLVPAATELPTSAPVPTTTSAPTATPAPADRTWMTTVNDLRALAQLPPITENATWSAEAVQHSGYVVGNDTLVHAEDTGNPMYSAAGDRAGRNGNVMASSAEDTSDARAVELWMTAPFHGLYIIHPRWLQSGFGSYREDGPQQPGTSYNIRMAATLDTLRGRDTRPISLTFPLLWPANGTTLPFASYNGGEWPDPLTGCPGYTAPTGAPLYVQLGGGNVTPNVTAFTLMQDGAPVESCVYHQNSYVNADSAQQQLARSILKGQSAVVVMPRTPLTPGATYTATLTANGATSTWSFTVAPDAH